MIRNKLLLLLAAILVLNLAFIRLKWMPAYTALTEARSENENFKEKPDPTVELQALKRKVKAISHFRFTDLDAYDLQKNLYRELALAGHQWNVQTVSISEPVSRVLRETTEYSFKVTLSGSYHSLLRLLHQIENQGNYFTVSCRFHLQSKGYGKDKTRSLHADLYIQSFKSNRP